MEVAKDGVSLTDLDAALAVTLGCGATPLRALTTCLSCGAPVEPLVALEGEMRLWGTNAPDLN